MAGALSRRDIEMIFRAETDKATRPIAELGKAAKASRAELQNLVEAADRGEVSLDRLGATTRDLKKAQDELGTARALLTQLNAQEAALDRAGEKAESAAKKYADLQQQVEAADKPTKRLVGSMEAAGRASAAAAERLNQVQAEAAQTRGQIESIIGPVNNVGDAFRTIANTSLDISRGLAVAGQAADDFKQKMMSAATAAASVDTRLNADVGFEQQGRSAGLLQAQIDYISQFENRVELLAQAKRELVAQNANFDQALRAQEAKVGEANVLGLRREIEQTFAAAEQAKQINGFKQIAADAKASAADVRRFGVAQDATTESTQRFGQALSAILSPESATNRTIDTIGASIGNAAATMEIARKSAADLNVVLNDLTQAGAGIERIGRAVDAFKTQDVVLSRASAAYQAAVADVNRLADAIQAIDTPTEEMTRELRLAEAAMAAAGTEMQREAAKAQEMSNALRRAGVDVRDLAAAERTLATQATQTRSFMDKIRDRQGGKGGLFGLTPTDATNLSYQINDIFTQLVSGQSIFITLAQQSPQIWQIGGVQAYAASLSGLLVPLGLVAGSLALVAAGAALVYKATSPDENTQAAMGYLAMLGETADITAEKMGAAANRLEDFGAKSAEAGAIVRDFLQSDLNPEYLDLFVEAVGNAADATGVDLPQAAQLLTEAMSGSYDAIVALNEEFPVLTESELTHIRAMIDSGREDEARQLIFDRFVSKMDSAAQQMDGPWSNAWINLKNVASAFGDFLEGPMARQLSTLRRDLDSAAKSLNALLLLFQGFSVQEAVTAAYTNDGRAPGRAQRPGRGGRVANAPRTTAAGQNAVRDAEREAAAKGKTATAEDRITAARIRARRASEGKGFGAVDRARLEAIAVGEEQEKINAENERKATAASRKGRTTSNKVAREAESARKKAAREAEQAADQAARQAEQLQSALDAMGAKVARTAAGTLEEQLTNAATAVDREYAKLRRQLDEYAKSSGGKGMIGGLTIEQYRAQLVANQEILANQAKLKVYEENLNSILDERKQLLADIEDRAQRGEISSAQAIRDTAEVTSRFEPTILALTRSAVAFATSIAGANPSPELKAFLARMERASSAASGDDQEAVRKSANANVGREETKLNQVLSERNSLVEQYNTLAELGLITQEEAAKRSAAAYNASKVLIDQQIVALRAAVAEAAKLGAISPAAFAAFEARLQAIGAQASYISPQFAQLKQQVDGIISQGAFDAIDKIGAALGAMATGAISAGDAFRQAGMAVLGFIAQTAVMIAKLVAQALILKAIDSATGGFISGILKFMNGFGGKTGQNHNGGTIGSYAGGVQSTTRVSVNPAALAAAPRYHSGTPSVGLRPNEQLSVLERGEKVMTEEQQKAEARAAGRAAGPAPVVDLKVVNQLDSAEITEQGLQDRRSQNTLVNVIRKNKSAINEALR